MTFFTDGLTEVESSGRVRFGVGRAGGDSQRARQPGAADHPRPLRRNPRLLPQSTAPGRHYRGDRQDIARRNGIMTRMLAVLCCLAMALGWCALAAAATCPKCRDLMFVGDAGKCIVCGADRQRGPETLSQVQRVAAPLRALPGRLGRRRQAAPRRAGGKAARCSQRILRHSVLRHDVLWHRILRHCVLRGAEDFAAGAAQADRSEACGHLRVGPMAVHAGDHRSGHAQRGTIGMAALRRPETAAWARQRLLSHAVGARLLDRRAADEMGPARLDALCVSPGQSAGTAPCRCRPPGPRPAPLRHGSRSARRRTAIASRSPWDSGY